MKFINKTFLNSSKSLKILGLIMWGSIIILYFGYKYAYGVSNIDIGKSLYFFVTTSTGGVLFYLLLYIIRPIILFPPSILAVISGIIFGPVLGTIYTLLGENLSANIAYYIGRNLGKDRVKLGISGSFSSLKKAIRENEFTSVLLIRAVSSPFDLVNYTCGIAKIKRKTYALATLLGSSHLFVMFVLLGASIENIESFNLSQISLNSSNLILAGGLYVGAIILTIILKSFNTTKG